MVKSSPVLVCQYDKKFIRNDRRVITRFFGVGDHERVSAVVNRVMSLSERHVTRLLKKVIDSFHMRHQNMEKILESHYNQVQETVEHYIKKSKNHNKNSSKKSKNDSANTGLSRKRKLLIGSYFTMEYAIESAALFNPSIAPHYNQSDVPEGSLRFIMSLRATGEGHLSSIVFRTGLVDELGQLTFDETGDYTKRMKKQLDRTYDKHLFSLKLGQINIYTKAANQVLDELPEEFTLEQLDEKIGEIEQRKNNNNLINKAAENMRWIAQSNYELIIPEDSEASQIVIFPNSENESHGIEDLRLTEFVDDDGSTKWFGTFTAYDGHNILTQILETNDFHRLRIHTLNGKHAQNKGMALFPRKVNGKYLMVSRNDGENMYLMRSDNVYFWDESVPLKQPKYPWEFVQIGNCGSPIETKAGWILITHGVGPMREYCIGATLLDLDDPSKVISDLNFPLIKPEADERNGYVPNVVYSCGAMKHGENLVIPYATNDSETRIASVRINELISAMT